MNETHPAEQVIRHIAPHLAALGYTKAVPVYTREKRLFAWRLKNPDPEAAMTSEPMVEVFTNDAYPNDRGEVFLHVWSWIGSEAPTHVAQELKRRGLECRVTTHKKFKGIRLKMEVQF